MNKKLILFLTLMMIMILGCTDNDVNVDEPKNTKNLIEIPYQVEQPAIVEEKQEEKINKTIKFCHDTDKGIVRWKRGTTFGFFENTSRFEFHDICRNYNYLIEYYCENKEPKRKLFLCRNGCEDAHCT